MSESTLVAKIKADAAAAVATAKAEATAAVSIVERETDVAVDALRSEHAHALKKRLAHLELVAISKAKQDANIALQQAKRSEVDALFDGVIHDLATQAADAYIAFFSKHAKQLVPAELTGVVVRAPESRLAETKDIVAKLSLTGEVVADRAVSAGLIVVAPDGVYDVTLSRLVDERRAQLEMQVIDALNS
jgi:vacuolar-type H+-ATPase subunit E/Vma4